MNKTNKTNPKQQLPHPDIKMQSQLIKTNKMLKMYDDIFKSFKFCDNCKLNLYQAKLKQDSMIITVITIKNSK